MLLVGPAWLTAMCDAGGRTARWVGRLNEFPVVAIARRAMLPGPRRETVLATARGLAMMLLSRTFRASWSIGLASALVAAVPPGRVARAENIVGGAFAPPMLELSASEGAFRHLRALQDIASESGGRLSRSL